MNRITDWIKRKTESEQKNPQHSQKTPSGNSGRKDHSDQKHPHQHQRKPQHQGQHRHHHRKDFHKRPSSDKRAPSESHQDKNHRFRTDKLLKIIPIAGLDEVGKNMNAVEYNDEIMILECGLQFPEPGMFGIDYVIPDTTYLEQNKKKIKGVLITHGHLDHMGGLRHILPKLGFPTVYGSALTIGMIEKHLSEFKLGKQTNLKVVENGKPFRLGTYEIEFFAQNHSIPDSNGIVLRTPLGNIVHTGDYKFDFTPAWGDSVDLQNLARIGAQGVLALMGESTNATKPGYTMSEKKVAEN